MSAPPTTDGTAISPVDIARVCHEAIRAIQHIDHDPHPSPPWDDAPPYQRDAAVAGVVGVLAGSTPQDSHDGWCDELRAAGWTWGEVKDPDAKTHPCLVPYDELPYLQQVKDHVFVAIVEGMSR